MGKETAMAELHWPRQYKYTNDGRSVQFPPDGLGRPPACIGLVRVRTSLRNSCGRVKNEFSISTPPMMATG
jgi:hypothetical protein